MPSSLPFGPADDARAEPRDPEVGRQAQPGASHLRLEEDRRTVQRLAEAGFEGPEFDRYEAELAARGYRTLNKWTRPPRLIFQKCYDRGILLTPRTWTEDERFDLVQDSVATGHRRFCDRALRGRQWTPEGGATLGTYYIGALLYAFSDTYRAWQAVASARALQTRELTPEMGMVLADPRQRVGAVVVDRDTVMRALHELDPRLAKVIALTEEQFSQKEIAEILGAETTPRAVEALLRRHRGTLPGKGTRP